MTTTTANPRNPTWLLLFCQSQINYPGLLCFNDIYARRWGIHISMYNILDIDSFQQRILDLFWAYRGCSFNI